MVTTSRNGRTATDPVRSTDDDARRVLARIEEAFRDEQVIYDRMDKDYRLWTLDKWQPEDLESPLSAEDIYTTNAPRVLAEKIIAFISATELIIRISNDNATDPQEQINDLAEELAIGVAKIADDRLLRRGHPSVKEALAFYATVRGRYAAVRATLRKGADGRTFPDILPLDPRHLVIEWGEEEPIWAAYRMSFTRREIRARYGNISFDDARDGEDDMRPEFVYEYYGMTRNRQFDEESLNPFDQRPNLYIAGTVIQNKWVKPLRDIHTLKFPVTAVPVDSQPHLTPNENGLTTIEHFGESVFAENRRVWEIRNRVMSYGIDAMGKAADPRQKVFSSDGTMTTDEGGTEKGSLLPLSVANQENIENFEEADVSRSAGFVLAAINEDHVAGALPPQAFGLLDKPLSSVALRQLGNNLEHRVMPRMKAVSNCIEIAIQNLLDQYETGGFDSFPVAGRTLEGRRFAGKRIEPEQIAGHDPIEVTMQLALPEDLSTVWAVAQQAMAPVTPNGEPLASLEWVREKILRLPSHRVMRDQNLKLLARTQDELAATLEAFHMAVKEQDQELAAIMHDRLRIALLKRQVEGSMMIQQLAQMASGIASGAPVAPPGGGGAPPQGGGPNLAGNPAAGGPGVAEVRGVGNQPSPEAGFNTTASRQQESDIDARLAAIGLERG